ncbi:glucose-1-phosphate thymidylyltransferase RfbA [Gammaproteobacteria bacterium]|nr:glucose-1-phosphate thymidylyltransferase RfbA [Gammaproteobacteria bacterium]
MKGIILAGGSGTRLHPLTKVISKQLLPVYDKPLIYYPLSILMQAEIREILIICTSYDIDRFKVLLGDGSDFGMSFEYIIQPSPDGIAQAFILGKNFIGNDDVCLILGDNIFYGQEMNQMLLNAISCAKEKNVATVFGYNVQDPQRYGVIDFDENGKALSIVEKPENPKSNYAVTGLYCYPNDVVQKVLTIEPSSRGELEITSINELFLNENRLNIEIMNRGSAWLDAGTFESLMDASVFIEAIEKRQGLKVACIEEIAFNKGYITKNQLIKLSQKYNKNSYGKYLLKQAENS